LSVTVVVVDAGVVVEVVVDELAAPVFPAVEGVVPAVVVVVLPDPVGGVVVVVVGGATKGVVCPDMVVWVLEGVAVRLVQPRAASQLRTAAAAGCPVSGWGSPATMVAGRKMALVTWRPWAEMINDPLSVSGGVSS
jgi:hypothetical protein